MIEIPPGLIEKYSGAGPRYTSYPTAPNWSKNFGPKDFHESLRLSNKNAKPLSLYLHIPFCEERCTFCACSVVATKRREVTESYLKSLLREIEIVSEVLDKNRPVVQIHWGGGTPTYLTSEEIAKIHRHIAQHFQIATRAEISMEIDPRVTTDEQLITLKELDFNRISLGVQDFDPDVQALAGRIQSFVETAHAVLNGRRLGFQSINIDLVYGLPKQNKNNFQNTLQQVLSLDPDRIALFNFAYVPWIHSHQKQIDPKLLPTPQEKLEMFCQAIDFFENSSYAFIGLDHFAKKEDELCKAQKEGTMYRNFQGYTTHRECDLIGLGVTAISHVNKTFAQNSKKLKDYEEGIFKTGLTTQAGLKLSDEDLKRQEIIREIFCHQRAFLNGPHANGFHAEREKLKSFEADGLVSLEGNSLHVTKLGRLFLRNIGSVFDAYFQPDQQGFSNQI